MKITLVVEVDGEMYAKLKEYKRVHYSNNLDRVVYDEVKCQLMYAGVFIGDISEDKLSVSVKEEEL